MSSWERNWQRWPRNQCCCFLPPIVSSAPSHSAWEALLGCREIDQNTNSFCCFRFYKKSFRYPNGVTLHAECVKDERVCPLTGQVFTVVKWWQAADCFNLWYGFLIFPSPLWVIQLLLNLVTMCSRDVILRSGKGEEGSRPWQTKPRLEEGSWWRQAPCSTLSLHRLPKHPHNPPPSWSTP